MRWSRPFRNTNCHCADPIGAARFRHAGDCWVKTDENATTGFGGLVEGHKLQSEVRTITLEIYVNDPGKAKQAQIGKWLDNVELGPYQALLGK